MLSIKNLFLKLLRKEKKKVFSFALVQSTSIDDAWNVKRKYF